jgi:hypothetical protein
MEGNPLSCSPPAALVARNPGNLTSVALVALVAGQRNLRPKCDLAIRPAITIIEPAFCRTFASRSIAVNAAELGLYRFDRLSRNKAQMQPESHGGRALLVAPGCAQLDLQLLHAGSGLHIPSN